MTSNDQITDRPFKYIIYSNTSGREVGPQRFWKPTWSNFMPRHVVYIFLYLPEHLLVSSRAWPQGLGSRHMVGIYISNDNAKMMMILNCQTCQIDLCSMVLKLSTIIHMTSFITKCQTMKNRDHGQHQGPPDIATTLDSQTFDKFHEPAPHSSCRLLHCEEGSSVS